LVGHLLKDSDTQVNVELKQSKINEVDSKVLNASPTQHIYRPLDEFLP